MQCAVSFAESPHEADDKHIHETAQIALEPVLADAVPARMMLDGDLRRSVTFDRRQAGNQAMQFAVKGKSRHFGPVTLEATIVVVQADAADAAEHPVEDPAREDLVPGIVAHSLPAADDVVALVELGQHPGDLRPGRPAGRHPA